MSSSRIQNEDDSQGKDLVTSKDKPPHKADKSALPTAGDDSTSGIALAAFAITGAAAITAARKVRER